MGNSAGSSADAARRGVLFPRARRIWVGGTLDGVRGARTGDGILGEAVAEAWISLRLERRGSEDEGIKGTVRGRMFVHVFTMGMTASEKTGERRRGSITYSE